MEQFIQKLIDEGVLKKPQLISVFKKIQRIDFVPVTIKERADEDEALPTFADQTISQPYTVAFMLELLEVEKGMKVLDVGSGSGWVTGILAELVGPKGKVFGIERVEELVEFSHDNLKKYKKKNVKIIHGDGYAGLPNEAPFDRIHVAAAAPEVPVALKEQLKIGGRMIIPTVKNDLRLIEKVSEKKFTEKKFPGFVFVPLIENRI